MITATPDDFSEEDKHPLSIHLSEKHQSGIPVLVEEGHDRHGVEHLSAHGPAWSVDAFLWYFHRRETLAGQCLQRSEHGAAYERLAQVWLVHK